MSNLVPAEDIETIVGAPRHPTRHLAKAVSAEKKVYILHSQRCLDSGIDLRDCPYSLAIDEGIDPDDWPEDKPVHVWFYGDDLLVCSRCELPYE